MGSLERRLARLEAGRQRGAAELSREALAYLSDEDLDALEDALETGQEDGTATFEELYRVATERSRRALGTYLDALEAIERGEEPRVTHQAGGEKAEGGRNGYRIWKYYRK